MAPLQKRAWFGLGIIVVVFTAILAIVITKGATSWDEDTGMRLIVYALFAAGIASYGIMLFLTRRKPGQSEIMDERDRVIMSRVPTVQLWAVVISLVVWNIALTGSYGEQGEIPIVFHQLMVSSILIISVLAQVIGILIGYRRMG